MMLAHRQKYVRLALLAAVLALPAGCVERMIAITSEPAGALVYLNDEEVGRTPLKVPFTYYGVYDVRLELDGYQPLLTTQKTNMPVWDAMGPDLVAEAIPGAKSIQEWNFVLQPAVDADADVLISHAKQMRALTREGGPTTQPTTQPAQP